MIVYVCRCNKYFETLKRVSEALARAYKLRDFFFFCRYILGVLPPNTQKTGYATETESMPLVGA